MCLYVQLGCAPLFSTVIRGYGCASYSSGIYLVRVCYCSSGVCEGWFSSVFDLQSMGSLVSVRLPPPQLHHQSGIASRPAHPSLCRVLYCWHGLIRSAVYCTESAVQPPVFDTSSPLSGRITWLPFWPAGLVQGESPPHNLVSPHLLPRQFQLSHHHHGCSMLTQHGKPAPGV